MAAMAAPKTRPKKTIEDFHALGEGVCAELIHGELYVTPAPQIPHQEAIENLYLHLAPQILRLGLGRLHLSPMDVHFPSGDVVQPDLIFVSKANEAIRQDWIRGVPDLLIEVVSPTNPHRDRFVKRELYAQNGVPAYWIVDLEEQSDRGPRASERAATAPRPMSRATRS